MRASGWWWILNAEALLDYRRRKDDHFRSGRGPLRQEALATFTGLSYFPPAAEWQFLLPLQAAQVEGEFMLDTTSGEMRTMALIGVVSVPLPEGSAHDLQVFGQLGDEERHSAFIPFQDLTSGRETYGAGRYLDAPLLRTEQGLTAVVDFNLAYHPYCAYEESWTCPLPPPQNRLPVAVRAGERLTLEE